MGWLLVGLVIFFSLTPSPPAMPEFTGGDKFCHLAAYALMTIWFGLIYLPGRRYSLLGVGFILMGVLLELAQGLMGYRTLDIKDMTANAMGVLVGWLLAKTSLSLTLLRLEDILTKAF